MTLLGKIKGLATAALASVSNAFTPKAPKPVPASRAMAARSMAAHSPLRFWWRSRFISPSMRHKLANDKGLMFAENPLLRGLLALQYKEFP